jgi:uncharacterized protein (TIGR02246 family)
MRLTILALSALLAAASRVPAQSTADELTIRRLRSLYNTAIAKHDTAGIGAVMTADIVVVTSNSVHTVGREAILALVAGQFRARPDVVYERTPDEVRAFEPWGMASERGHWTGSWTDTDGKIQVGGTYFAKWRRRNGSWLIESETFVPERCSGGAYCRIIP